MKPYRFVLALLAAVRLMAAQEIPDLDRKLGETISSTLKQSGAPSASVAIVRNGSLAFAKAFGNATAETRYAIGSISKPIHRRGHSAGSRTGQVVPRRQGLEVLPRPYTSQ